MENPDHLPITDTVSLNPDEVEWQAIRAQGAGGQNVNKVSSAVHLRFDIRQSSLPEVYKSRLLSISDKRLTRDGVIVIKAQQHRRQELNREAALKRLVELIKQATIVQKSRRPTRPSRRSVEKRLNGKSHRSQVKTNRSKIDFD